MACILRKVMANSPALAALFLAFFGFSLLCVSLPSELTIEFPTQMNNTNLSINWSVVNFSFYDSTPDTCIIDIYNTTTPHGNITIDMSTNGTWGYCSYSILDQPDGRWNYTVCVNDTGGSWLCNGTWFIGFDVTAPAPTIYLPQNTTYGILDLALNFSYNESYPETCWFDHNGTNTTLPSCDNYTFTATDDAVTTLMLYMNDTVGNFNSSNVTFTADTTYPINMTPVSPTVANGSNVSSTSTVVNFTFYDVNPNQCTLEFDNGTSANYTMTVESNSTGGHCYYEVASQPDGRWNYTVYVNDSAGNMNSTGLYDNWFEAAVPTISVYLPGNTTYNSTTVNISYVSTDAFGVNTTWYQYNGSNVTMTGNGTFTALANTGSSMIVWANDSAGNNGSTTVYFSTDTEIPSLTILSPDNATNTSSSWTNFTINVTDNNDTVFLCNLTIDGANVNGSYTVASGIAYGFYNNYTEGLHLWNVTCWDEASRNVSATRYMTYDATYPTYTLVSPTNTTYSTNQSLQINYTVNDTHLNASFYSLNNLTNITLTGNRTFNVTGDGCHYLMFNVNDSANNTNTTRIDFTVDLTAPVVTLITPTNGSSWTANSTVIFYYNVTDIAAKNCTLVINPGTDPNSTSVTVNTSQSFTKTLSNGDYTWYVTCYDNANHVNSSSANTLTVSYTTASPSTSSSGSSGSGSSDTETQAKETMSWDSILTTAPAEMAISNDNIPVTKVKITVSETISSVSLSVEGLSSKPSDVTAAPGDSVYKYLKFDAPNLNVTRAASMTVEFKVTKGWIETNLIDPDQVTLNRYNGGSWARLTTEKTGTTTTHYTYTATVPGFSYFSISGSKKPLVCESDATKCINETYLQTCSSDRTEWITTQCQFGCDNSTKACYSALSGNCTTGQTKCQGSGLWKCNGSVWSFETMCKYGCSGNACGIGTDDILWYGLIIGAIAACAVFIVVLIWHEKVHHTTKPGVPARNPIRQGSVSLANPMLTNKLGELSGTVKNSFVMPVKPSELEMKKPQGMWLRGRLRKW
ncbi:MAG: PGF-pre-PGF domain-containing protein [Candidatus Aenigmatarchaeota archaeon]